MSSKRGKIQGHCHEEAAAASEAESAAAAAADITGTDDEQAAATKLQSMQRGRAARAKVGRCRLTL